MITPQEIEDKEFNKALRGYNAEEVDEFLDQIILDLQEIITENDRLKAENADLLRKLEEYKESQKSVMNTLDSAKKLMKDISESAEKRADVIIKNAKLDAAMIVKDANDSISRYSGMGEELKNRVMYFRSRYKQMLLDELADIDDKGGDLLSDLEKEFSSEDYVTSELPETDDSEAILEEISASETTPAATEAADTDDSEEAGAGADGRETADDPSEKIADWFADRATMAIDGNELNKILGSEEDDTSESAGGSEQ